MEITEGKDLEPGEKDGSVWPIIVCMEFDFLVENSVNKTPQRSQMGSRNRLVKGTAPKKIVPD